MIRNLTGRRAFTLIEVLISMTIMALVVTVLYQAFATATRVWNNQQLFDETAARQQAAARLLRDDFARLAPYTWNDGSGKHTFFAAGEQVLFYVTRNGFGCLERGRARLFFTCCYLTRTEDDSYSLMLYKVAQPRLELCKALGNYAAAAVQSWKAPQEMREHSVTILSGLSSGSFSFDRQRYLPVDAVTTGSALEDDSVNGADDLEKVRRVQFNYSRAGVEHSICAACYHPPLPDDEKEQAGKKPLQPPPPPGGRR